MLNIQLENPSFEQYIKEFGKQEIEKMFLTFLELKVQLNQPSKNNQSHNELNVPAQLHQKILAMKPTKEQEAQEINDLLDKTSDRFNGQANQWEEVDRELRSLKVINEIGGEELRKSFNILASEIDKNGVNDYKCARDEYLTNKYNK